jgi:hypothetical protein
MRGFTAPASHGPALKIDVPGEKAMIEGAVPFGPTADASDGLS